MHTGKAKSSELVMFEDGTLYHIDLKRSDGIPPNILLMGAADRVDTVAKQFDSVTFAHHNKARPEFRIIAGTYKKVPVAALSIGMGPGNVEIVLNELHALFEYDHTNDSRADAPAPLRIIRVGTCGTSLPDVPAGAFAISEYSIGLDNLGVYYPAAEKNVLIQEIEKAFLRTKLGIVNSVSYCSAASPAITNGLKKSARRFHAPERPMVSGITTASPGFFAPEGRTIGRAKTAFALRDFIEAVQSFEVHGLKIVNHEMETSILFRLGHEILGYEVGAICLVLDNLATDDFLESEAAAQAMDRCISIALDALIESGSV